MKPGNSDLPFLLVSDDKGNVFEVPELRMAGMSLDECRLPEGQDLVELPQGSNLYVLPCRTPIGWDPGLEKFVELAEYEGMKVSAVAAFMAPAYLQILRSAYRTNPALRGFPCIPTRPSVGRAENSIPQGYGSTATSARTSGSST